ncbi:MAG: hypothetical protein ACE5GM_00820 [bacterium]
MEGTEFSEKNALKQVWEKENQLQLELEEAKAEAERIVSQAKGESHKIVSGANQNREEAIKAASVSLKKKKASDSPQKTDLEQEKEELGRLKSAVEKNKGKAVEFLVKSVGAF